MNFDYNLCNYILTVYCVRYRYRVQDRGDNLIEFVSKVPFLGVIFYIIFLNLILNKLSESNIDNLIIEFIQNIKILNFFEEVD